MDVLTIRIAVFGLVACGVLAIGGIALAGVLGEEPPQALETIGVGALAALGGLLTGYAANGRRTAETTSVQ